MLDDLTKQKEDLEEVETEIELVDEDEQVMSVLRLPGAPSSPGRATGMDSFPDYKRSPTLC